MPISYHYSLEERLISVKVSGSITLDDRETFFLTLLSDRSIPLGTPLLIDLTDIDPPSLTTEMFRFAGMLGHCRSCITGRVGIASEQVGTATLCCLLAFACETPDSPTRSFSSIPEAKAWLTSRT